MTTHEKPTRVLVVDDNRDAAASMAELLAAAGFEVETCFDGPSAVAAAGTFAPEACLLDINMPVMDGYDLARRLRERFADRPPVFATMTAYEDYSHLERAADAGFDLQFTKPVDPAAIAAELDEAVRRGEPAAGTEGGAAEQSVLRRVLLRLIGRWKAARG